jgi:hypothetical protein
MCEFLRIPRLPTHTEVFARWSTLSVHGCNVVRERSRIIGAATAADRSIAVGFLREVSAELGLPRSLRLGQLDEQTAALVDPYTRIVLGREVARCVPGAGGRKSLGSR